MLRSSQVRTLEETRRWEDRLNRERPQRRQAAEWIVDCVGGNGPSTSKVVELACGAGYLAGVLLARLPDVQYCGIDLSPHLLAGATQRIAGKPGRGGAAVFRCADLVRDDWIRLIEDLGWAGSVDAVVSLQALHDLGGLAQQIEALARARTLLRPGGLLVYADLLPDRESPHPSRYACAQHLEMLRAARYGMEGDEGTAGGAAPVASRRPATARFGDFGCFCTVR